MPRTIWLTLSLASIPTLIAAWAQLLFAWQPMPIAPHIDPNYVSGFFGNGSALGAYLIMMIPIAEALDLSILAVAQLFTLMIAQSRLPIILISLAVFSYAVIKQKKAILLAVPIALGIILSFNTRDMLYWSLVDRGLAWQSTIEATSFAPHLIGPIPGNAEFSQYNLPCSPSNSRTECIVIMDAHNLLLNIAYRFGWQSLILLIPIGYWAWRKKWHPLLRLAFSFYVIEALFNPIPWSLHFLALLLLAVPGFGSAEQLPSCSTNVTARSRQAVL